MRDAEFRAMNAPIIEEFRANAGRVGGPFAGAPMVLLTTMGRRSGQPHTTPLMCLPDGDRLLVFASKGGAPAHPAWYLNLRAHPAVTVEYGTDTFPAIATPLEGAERDAKYAEQASRYPQFGQYQQRTERVIPVVALERIP
ncbi:MAG: nitroreductase family deazaflavin-dependent oxidoreductase [Actinomycetota bacterium]